jgi:hypothetical protein
MSKGGCPRRRGDRNSGSRHVSYKLFASILTSPPHVRIDTPISDMVRVAAITEADIARAPISKPAPKRSPDIIARAVGGNRLRFRRLDFVLKLSR